MSISRVYKIVNDMDDLVYIGSTKQILCRRMTEHRKSALKGCERKLYIHMRDIGSEHFKIMCVREYKDISKERLKYKEDKYIKIFDTVKTGLNMSYAFGKKCLHGVKRGQCKECKGSQICDHNKRRCKCKYCGGNSTCEHTTEKRNWQIKVKKTSKEVLDGSTNHFNRIALNLGNPGAEDHNVV